MDNPIGRIKPIQADSIAWTSAKLERFKRALAASPDNVFTFEGHEFLPAYARYLIQYLESVFG